MREIGSFNNQEKAEQFSYFLKNEGIENTIDANLNSQTEDFIYSVWVHNEDLLEKAKAFLDQYKSDPQNPVFQFNEPVNEDIGIDEKPVENLQEKTSHTYPITVFVLLLCIGIYLLNIYQTLTIQKKEQVKTVLMTPVQYYLLYDIPHILIEMDQFIRKQDVDLTKDLKKLPDKVQKKMDQIEKIPYWKGFYDLFFDAVIKKEKIDKFPPLFEKIRKGDLWRIFSPAFLHTNFLHLLFNMLWLWFLGKQIEERITKFRYIFLILFLAAMTNTLQYLMSGPYFLGYSGVIMGMVGFIWMRQKKAPWEGYPLQKTTLLFILIFIFAMFALSLFSFFFEIYGKEFFAVPIANTAHIAGGIIGVFLGRLNLFGEAS